MAVNKRWEVEPQGQKKSSLMLYSIPFRPPRKSQDRLGNIFIVPPMKEEVLPPKPSEGFCKLIPDPVCLKPQPTCWICLMKNKQGRGPGSLPGSSTLCRTPHCRSCGCSFLTTWALLCSSAIPVHLSHKEEMWVRNIVTEVVSEIIVCLGVRGPRIPFSLEMPQLLETTIASISLTGGWLIFLKIYFYM